MTDDTYQLLAAYAVDAVTDEERTRVEDYLLSRPEHLAELDSLRDAAAGLGAQVETPPPASLRASVLDAVAQTRPLPPVTEPPARLLAEKRPRRAWFVAAAAAAVIGVGTVAVQQYDRSPAEQVAISQVAGASDARSYDLVMPGHNATVTRSKAMGKAVFRSTELGSAPSGRAYQLWLQQPDGSMLSAGVLPGPKDGAVQMVLHGDAAKAVGVGITMEPAGGSTSPSGKPLAVAAF
ncbi:anti-sigma factor domain-containing protein [Yimella sp. cx-51]|uniref:anti-sigma factor n=1 Tax=Yimella sp. cx-51 TaxID=2770551 RepID=UPI00165DB651|nr:anti-sigma factor [Yimella sp. cx-51]MBC9956764.1 anti-sigma factor [Yimella sp. cx-51]MBD2759191.1 anti-sigma factor [Yimella sp. cx-573]QTH38999.1 anti-sigma factor [Yimella sp. cx-51]